MTRIGKEYKEGMYRSILQCFECGIVYHWEGRDIKICERCGADIKDD